MFAWLILFVVSHVAAVFFPGDDPTGDGPWSLRAYVIFNVVLILMSAVGAAVVVATVRPWGRRLPRWVLLAPLWFGSALLVARGVPGMVENLLMVSGNRGGFVGADDISTAEFWAGIGINTYFFVGAVLLVVTTVSYVRRSRGGGDTAQATSRASAGAAALRTPPPPPPWARRAGHVAWVAPILGFIPLHIPWILGIPLFANPEPFREWYHGRGPGVGDHPVDGFLGLPAGALYLTVLCVLAALGGVLALGLISDWGVTFPRWIPVLRGRRVPRWLPLTPTVLGSALMIGYAVTLPWQFAAELADTSPEDNIFTTTGVLIGLPLLLAWAIALPVAGWSYHRRTRAPRR